MSGLLDGKIRLVMMRFCFSNMDIVPTCLKQRPLSIKTGDEKGRLYLPPVQWASGLSFLPDLDQLDYTLADAFFQVTYTPHQAAIVRYDFPLKEECEISPKTQAELPECHKSLRRLLGLSLWRIRVFVNPFFYDDVLVENQFTLSVNLEGRVPMFGKHMVRRVDWEKDVTGKKIGVEPVEVRPRWFLRIEDGEACFKQAS